MNGGPGSRPTGDTMLVPPSTMLHFICGLFSLAERLIMMHPEQVNAVGGRIVAPPRFHQLRTKDISTSQIYSTNMVQSWVFQAIR